MGSALALLILDIIVAIDDLPGNTISEILRDWSAFYPLPYAFGVVMGHLFWNSDRKSRFTWIWPTFIPILLLPPMSGGNILVFLAGVVIGAYLWPQKIATESEVSNSSSNNYHSSSDT